MKKLRGYVCLVVVAGAVWLASPDMAWSHDDEPYSLDQAVVLVKKKFGGKVLKAASTERRGRRVHRIRVLTEDGHVRTFSVDAENGSVE